MASADQRPLETADLELSLAPVGDRFALTMRLARPGDAADLRGDDQHCTINALGERRRGGAGYDIVYLIAHGAFIDGAPNLYLAGADGTLAVAATPALRGASTPGAPS